MIRSEVKLRFSPRGGISLIEVLVAMLVALIGVFGVFVLIPFAVRQVEIGLNEEAAQTLARNAMNDFEAHGFQDVVTNAGVDTLRWAIPDYTAGVPFYNAEPKDATTDRFYCIDPWGLSQFLNPTDDPATLTPAFQSFPFFQPSALPPTPPATLRIPRISLFDRTNTVFSRALARRLFSGHDDLTVEAPPDDFSGPTQVFFTTATGNGGRQYAGRLSCQMFVFRDSDIDDYARFFTAVSLARVANQQDRVFEITRPNFPLGAPANLFGGGDVQLTEFEGTEALDSTVIRRGLWMALLVTDSAGVPIDLAFHRVLESHISPGGPSPRQYDVTLQGSDVPVPAGSRVFAVLMPSVIAVYERTMKFETSSDWNVN
jgi:type II secretory pathway pseudopilin PulG